MEMKENEWPHRGREVPVHELGSMYVVMCLAWVSRKLRCYFVSNPQSSFFETDHFHNLVKYVAIEGQQEGLSFKKSARYFLLVKDGVKSLQEAKTILEQLVDASSLAEVKSEE